MAGRDHEAIDAVLAEAELNGVVREALSQVSTTAMALSLFVEQPHIFSQWRAFCTARGWESGPKSPAMLREHAKVFAHLAEGVEQ